MFNRRLIIILVSMLVVIFVGSIYLNSINQKEDVNFSLVENKVISEILPEVNTQISVESNLEDYGSLGAFSKSSYTIEEMLNYAIEDEYAAKAEYYLIMDKFDIINPFSNIVKSEDNHIKSLSELFVSLNMEVPTDDAVNHLVIPEDLKEVYSLAVQAEINNIDMYKIFLNQELPAEVEEVFTSLMNASENHLNTFEKKLNSL